MNAFRAFRAVLVFLVAICSWRSSHAATITWRGGTDEFYDTAANWNLPDDIPPGTPADQLENFRRVPGSLDKAVITAGAGDVVRVRDVRSVNMLESTKRLVIGNAGNLTALIQSGAGPAQQTMGPVEVLKGGRLQFHFAVEFTGAVVVEGGGTLAVPLPVEPNAESRSVFAHSLFLRAPADDTTVRTATFIGTYQVAGPAGLVEIFWGSVHVNAAEADWRLGFVGPAQISFGRIRLIGSLDDVEGVTAFAWTGGKLLFNVGGEVQRASEATYLFKAETTLDAKARVTGGENLIIFEDSLKVGGFTETFITAPVLYRNVTVTVLETTEILPSGGPGQGPGFEATHSPGGVPEDFHTLGDGALFKVQGLARLRGLKLDGGTLELAAKGLFGVPAPVFVGSSLDETGERVPEPTEWHLVRGTLVKAAGAEGQALLVRDDSRIVIHPRTGGNLLLNVDILNHGVIAFTPEAAAADTIAGSTAQIINRADGTITLPGSGGFALEDGTLVNEGTVQITGPAEPRQPPAAPARAHLTGTFVNVGGTTTVTGHTTFVVNDGIVDQNGTLNLGAGTSFEIGSGFDTEITYPTGDELAASPTATVVLDRLFTLATTGTMTLADDVRVRLLGFGDTLLGTASGLRFAKPLQIPHLQMGGRADATPSVFLTADITGVGLVVQKTFAWFGGRFIGVNGSSHEVELGSLSATDLRSTDDNPGGATGSIRCTVVQTGSMIVNTTKGFGGVLVNETNGTILFQRCDGVFSSLINRGSMVKNTDAAITLGSNPAAAGRHEGTMNVDEGTVNLVTDFTVAAPIDTFSSTAVNLRGARLENTSINGPGQTLLDAVQLSGTVNVNNAQIGDSVPPNAVPDALTTSANTTLNIRGSVVWKNGHIRPGNNSKIVVQQNARLTIATENENGFFTRWERGTIENEGRVILVLDSSSKLVLTPNSKFVNRPGGVLVAEGEGDVLAAQLPSSPGLLENHGLVQLNVPRGRQQTLGAQLDQVAGETRLGEPGPEPDEAPDNPSGLARAGQVRRAADGPPRFVLRHPVNVQGGELTVNRPTRFEQDVRTTAGRLKVSEDGSGEFLLRNEVNGPNARLELAPGSTLQPTLGFGLTLLNQGTLAGAGFIRGQVNNTGGVISPGLGDASRLATLAIEGPVVLGSQSRLAFEVPDAASGVGDLLDVVGEVSFNGLVDVTLVDPPAGSPPRTGIGRQALKAGDFIPLVLFTSRQGVPAVVNGPVLPGGLRLEGQFAGTPQAFGVRAVAELGQADLSVQLAAPLTAPAGGELVHAFTVENLGPETATGIILEVALPANAPLAGSEPVGTVAAGKLSVPLPNLDANARTTVTVRFVAPAQNTAVAVAATVSSQRPDPALENNTASAVTAVLVGGGFTVGRFELNAGGKLKLTFETLPEVKYRLECSTDLTTWLPHRDFTGTGAQQSADDLGGEGREPEFFRLVVVP